VPPAFVVARGDERAFVFRYVAEDGVLGVFVPLDRPPPVGESVEVEVDGRCLSGVVAFRNGEHSDTPGAGVVLDGADDEVVDHLLEAVRTIAYLPRMEES
jgi:hypothetical protein